MNTSLVMTVIGSDRPGLVESISEVVGRHGGNWLESRMSHMAGHFAGILRVEISSELSEALIKELRGLDAQGLSVVVETDAVQEVRDDRRLVILEIVGQDHPGIVRDISEAIAAQGVNVEELSTECVSAPMTGEMLFKARATLQVPPDVDLDVLRAQLERCAADLMVDIEFGTPGS